MQSRASWVSPAQAHRSWGKETRKFRFTLGVKKGASLALWVLAMTIIQQIVTISNYHHSDCESLKVLSHFTFPFALAVLYIDDNACKVHWIVATADLPHFVSASRQCFWRRVLPFKSVYKVSKRSHPTLLLKFSGFCRNQNCWDFTGIQLTFP